MNGFEYVQVSTVEQAQGQLKQPHVLLKAGGIDVLDRLKEGLEQPRRVVSLAQLKDLDRVVDNAKDGLRIGPLVTMASLASNLAVRERYGAIASAAGDVATPQVRNVATLGGNLLQRPRCWYFRSNEFHCRKKGGDICYAQHGDNRYHAVFGNFMCAIVHPSTVAGALVAFGATVKVVGPKGSREVLLEKFLTPPQADISRENTLSPDEILVEVHVPAPAAGTRSAYLKQGEKESFDWPIAEVSVVLVMDGSTCRRASVVLGAAAPVPHRATQAEAALAGKVLDRAVATDAARLAMQGATPLERNGYKVKVFKPIIRRALMAAGGVS